MISPDEGYALREYARTTGQGEQQLTFRGTLTYNVDRNGIPLVEQIDCRQEQGSRGALIQRDVVDVSKFDTEPPRESYFRADSM